MAQNQVVDNVDSQGAQAPAPKKRNWLLWVLGALVVVGLVIFAVIVGKTLIGFFSDKVQVESATPAPTLMVRGAAVAQPTAIPVVAAVQPTVAPTAIPVVAAVQPTVAPTAVPVAAVEPTAIPTAVTVAEAPKEAVFDGTTVTADFKGALPNYIDLRNTNREPGDESMYIIKFAADFPRIGILRLVCDDACIFATFYASPTAQGVDLLPLLKMGKVDATTPADPLLRKYMEARGVNLGGEDLSQNYATVFFGAVKASDGAFLVIRMKDDPTLMVNNGGLVSFSADTEPYTVDLTGTVITNPTFVLEK